MIPLYPLFLLVRWLFSTITQVIMKVWRIFSFRGQTKGYRAQNVLTATTDSVLTCLAWTAVEIQRKRVKQVWKQGHREFHCWPENRFSSQQNFVGVDNNVCSFLPEMEERLQTGSVLPISNGLIFHHSRQLPSHSQDNYSAPS